MRAVVDCGWPGLRLGTGGVAGGELQRRRGSVELLFGCTWVKGEWCGGGVVKGGGQGRAFFIGRSGRARGGHGGGLGLPRACLVGDLQGEGGTGVAPTERG